MHFINKHTASTSHCTRAEGRGWPPQHIPIVVDVSRVGLFDLRDRDVAILGLPTLGGLFDLPGLPLGGGVLDLYVYVGHGRIRSCPFSEQR